MVHWLYDLCYYLEREIYLVKKIGKIIRKTLEMHVKCDKKEINDNERNNKR